MTGMCHTEKNSALSFDECVLKRKRFQYNKESKFCDKIFIKYKL